MHVKVLKFLIEARHHLLADRDQGKPAAGRDDLAHDDLQAVDRALPDCDWFEVEEVRAGRRGDGAEALWEERAATLRF
jgi:hypothetical protein